MNSLYIVAMKKLKSNAHPIAVTQRICCGMVVAAAFMTTGCKGRQSTHNQAAARQELPPRPARINHVVFFKLKDSADAAELIADCDAMLGMIPGVVSYYAGQHLDTGRDTVDSHYDVGFFVGFTTEAEYAVYVQHPNHVAAVEKWQPRWEWIKVYDVLDETP